MEIDHDKIDEAVLALLWLTLHDGYRAWKGFDWATIDLPLSFHPAAIGVPSVFEPIPNFPPPAVRVFRLLDLRRTLDHGRTRGPAS